MVGYPQTNRKIDTGKTLTRWPVFVDHFKEKRSGGVHWRSCAIRPAWYWMIVVNTRDEAKSVTSPASAGC